MKNTLFLLLLTTVLVTSINAQVTTTLTNGHVLVSTTNADSVNVSFQSNLLKINGVDPSSGPIAREDISSFEVLGDDGDNSIDVSGLDGFGFGFTSKIIIRAMGGDDTVTGSRYEEEYRLGPGDDEVLSFGGGTDFYYWGIGDGSEMNSHAGQSGELIFFYDGSDSDEAVELSSSTDTIILEAPETGERLELVEVSSVQCEFNGGDDSIVASDMTASNIYNSYYINMGDGENFVNLDQSNAIYFVRQDSLSANDTVIGPNARFNNQSSIWQQTNEDTGDDSSITLREDNDPEFTLVEFDNGVDQSTARVKGFNILSIKGSDGDQEVSIQNLPSESIKSVQLLLSNGEDTVNTVLLEEIELDVIGENNVNSIDTLVIDAQGEAIELDDEFELVFPYSEFARIARREVDVITILNRGIQETNDTWIIE